MKIIITGSLGNVGKPLTEALLAAGHEVTVVSSQAARKADIEGLGAQAAIGSVTDTDFLQQSFKGADALFAMTPPNLGGSDVLANTERAGKAFATAIKASGIKRVVMLSSIGADLPAGTGPIAGLHRVEQLYNQLEGVNVSFLRAGFFYTNFYNDIPLIKKLDIIGANYPAEMRLPLVHPGDIAAAAASALQKESPGKDIRYVISDVRHPKEFAEVLGKAIGKPELPWVEFTDEQSLQGMLQAGLPKEVSELYTEMGAGLRSGNIQSDFEKNGSPVTGKVTLEDFAKEFAVKF